MGGSFSSSQCDVYINVLPHTDQVSDHPSSYDTNYQIMLYIKLLKS